MRRSRAWWAPSAALTVMPSGGSSVAMVPPPELEKVPVSSMAWLQSSCLVITCSPGRVWATGQVARICASTGNGSSSNAGSNGSKTFMTPLPYRPRTAAERS